jgi:hypothetical protein
LCSHYDTDTWDVTDELGLKLGVAASDSYKRSGMILDDFVDSLSAFAVSHSGDCAGVDDTDVSRLAFFGFRYTM